MKSHKLADQCRNTGIQPTMTTVFQSSKIALIINSSVVTSNVKDEIKYAMKYTPLQTYLCQKNNWTPDTFQLTDWPSFAPIDRLAILCPVLQIHTHG